VSEGLSVLAVDDEQPALADLARLLRGLPSVGEVDVASSGPAALGKLSARAYDAVFLDVRMPELDGVELTRILRRFEQRPAVVFVTAYADAAVDAFELRAVDYLMKPVSRQRRAETLVHVGQLLATRTTDVQRVPGHDLVPAQNARGSTRLVPRSSILYVESAGDYVRLVCDDGRYLVRGHISDFEARWRSVGFVRVHRQYVASLGRAVELQPQLNGTALLVFPEGISIPVSRRHVPLLMKELES
jgi:DNA-binding LytR/AlgR family response regulator